MAECEAAEEAGEEGAAGASAARDPAAAGGLPLRPHPGLLPEQRGRAIGLPQRAQRRRGELGLNRYFGGPT